MDITVTGLEKIWRKPRSDGITAISPRGDDTMGPSVRESTLLNIMIGLDRRRRRSAGCPSDERRFQEDRLLEFQRESNIRFVCGKKHAAKNTSIRNRFEGRKPCIVSGEMQRRVAVVQAS